MILARVAQSWAMMKPGTICETLGGDNVARAWGSGFLAYYIGRDLEWGRRQGLFRGGFVSAIKRDVVVGIRSAPSRTRVMKQQQVRTRGSGFACPRRCFESLCSKHVFQNFVGMGEVNGLEHGEWSVIIANLEFYLLRTSSTYGNIKRLEDLESHISS